MYDLYRDYFLKACKRDNRNFFKSFDSFSNFCKKSKLTHQIEGIFKLFLRGTPERISNYELLAGIILFSTLTWKQKVILDFSLFDFDSDSHLKKDELQMLLLTFSNTITTTTKFKSQIPDILPPWKKTRASSCTSMSRSSIFHPLPRQRPCIGSLSQPKHGLTAFAEI